MLYGAPPVFFFCPLSILYHLLQTELQGDEETESGRDR